jgi:hypothetical protein
MKNLVPRLIGEPEAKRLGIENGWYGTRVSGTLMTGPDASLAACVAAIDLLPEPKPRAEVKAHAPILIVPPAKSIHSMMNVQPRTAYQIGRKPDR